MKVVPFCVDTEFFKPSNNKGDLECFTIGVVKGLEQVYDVGTLIGAFKNVQSRIKRDLKLVIIGEGSKRNDYEKLVAELELEKSIEFKGYLNNQELPQEYNSLNLVVVPSLRESFGLSLIEAMSCEVPVVASEISGFMEVGTEESITYFQAGNPEDLANKIGWVINNYEQSIDKAKLGRRRVEKLYALNNATNCQIEIYNRILAVNE